MYIAANIDVKKPRSEKVPPLPWKKVLTSAPVWAAVCGLVGFAWLAFNAMTLTPTYLDRIQNVSVDIVSRSLCLICGAYNVHGQIQISKKFIKPGRNETLK